MTPTTMHDLMRDATRLTRAGDLSAATQAIQRALSGAAAQGDANVLEGCVTEVADRACEPAPAASFPHAPRAAGLSAGEFVEGSHTHGSLTRHYKLYSPPGPLDRPLPLLVMLHGCTQDPDDFAAGTGMNSLAARQGFYVLYPAQAQGANPSRCWNWFKHNHQSRQRGEAALIAALTQAVVKAHGIDPERVYIAGLSAGGAMAALVAAAFPEVYAAVGVHSGLAPGAASSLPEGLAAMRSGAGSPPLAAPPGSRLQVPAIVFHGANDTTVHPRNGEQVIEAALSGSAASSPGMRPTIEQHVTPLGRHYTRSVYRTNSGPVLAEHWLLHGAGHAWSGGQAAGSYTDAQGPDASAEMLRFFLSHSRRVGPGAHEPG